VLRSSMKFKKIWKWEYIFLLLISVALILSCIIISSKKYYWNDELYSYYFLSDQSFSHMLAAFNDKINNTPILYFLVGWVWARVFGSTELSLRLFSCLGFCIAAIVLWVTLRRTYPPLSSALGLLTVFCTSDIILEQNAEARMYGLFLAVCSLGILQFDTLNRSEQESRSNLMCNVFIHAAIVNTHLFGIFYSGAIFLTQLIWDTYRKIFRTRIYLSIILGCLSLVFYIPTFLKQADAGKPRSWIPSPTLNDLTQLLNLSSPSFFQARVLSWIILASCILLLLNSFRLNNTQPKYQSLQNQQAVHKELEPPLLLLALSFLLVPIFVWLLSKTIKPIFVERYLIPSCLSWIILITSASSRLILEPQLRSILKNLKKSSLSEILANLGNLTLCTILIAYLLLQPIQASKRYSTQELPGSYLDEYGYEDLPIAVQSSHNFLQIFHYVSEKSRYFFILDWEAAVDENSGLFPPQEYKHLDALKRVYPEKFNNNIIQSDNFLQKYNRFLVLDKQDYEKKCSSQGFVGGWENVHCPQWLEMRILSNPVYQVQPRIKKERETLLLVERINS
jgi:hypothetical protein